MAAPIFIQLTPDEDAQSGNTNAPSKNAAAPSKNADYASKSSNAPSRSAACESKPSSVLPNWKRNSNDSAARRSLQGILWL